MLEISTFGGLSIECDGKLLTELTTSRAGALLIYLACTRQPHALNALAGLLWEQEPRELDMSNMRGVLSSLQRHVGEYVTITRDTVELNLDAGLWLDVDELDGRWHGSRKGPL